MKLTRSCEFIIKYYYIYIFHLSHQIVQVAVISEFDRICLYSKHFIILITVQFIKELFLVLCVYCIHSLSAADTRVFKAVVFFVFFLFLLSFSFLSWMKVASSLGQEVM